jgi:hypothetical protein
MRRKDLGPWCGVLWLGAALSVTAAQETVRYGYDVAGRLAAVGYAVAGTNATAVLYQYDPNGNRTNLVTYGLGDPTDTDGDGLRDVDELALFGTDPTLRDTDGDGLDDYQEWIAGTDPNDPASCFQITAIANLPPVEIHFLSSSNRLYTLHFTTNLPGGWASVPGQGPRIGIGGPDHLTDTNAAALTRFYRVGVQLP